MSNIFSTLVQTEDRVIAIVGAGGKTSLMFLLAHGFQQQSLQVITTTTTRIRVPASRQSKNVILMEEKHCYPRLVTALARDRHATIGHHLLPGNKLAGLSPSGLARIRQQAPADRMIIEADGARGLSLKAPGKEEPAVPAWTNLFIALVGLDCIGHPLTEDFVFRPELVAAITGLRLQEQVTPLALARLAVHPQGLLKGCPPTARSCIFFNKAEDTTARTRARQIIAAANTLPGTRPDFWVYGSIKQNTCTVLAAA